MKHGMLLVDKESGVTSHDVVARARRILKTKEIGHAGTLDPMAQGLMLLLVGEGTKLSQFLLEKDKRYRVQFRLGEISDTLDSTGEVQSTGKPLPDIEFLQKQVEALQGELDLEIPRYSAKQVDGRRLYDLARQGVDFTPPRKIMKFWDIQIHGLNAQGGDVTLSCSKGSFIRSWVSEMGERVGCGAVMSGLTRTFSNPYSLDRAIKLDHLEQSVLGQHAGATPAQQNSINLNEKESSLLKTQQGFVGLSEMLPDVKRIFVDGQDEKLLTNGQISHQLRSQLITRFQPEKDEFIQIQSKSNHQLLAIIGLSEGKGFQIRRVLRI